MNDKTKRGTIVKWFEDRGFGFIQPEGSESRNAQVFLHHSKVSIPTTQLREGLQVVYEEGQGRKGIEARNVRLAGAVDAPVRRGYRFHNPYNFVRTLPRREVTSDKPNVQLMGRTQPPMHDRWLGLSGEIKCRLETVTPLFISASDEVRVAKSLGPKKNHYSYQFFRLNGEKAIPATSLRGMTRSVFEAVTNSTFSNFGGQRLSYRLSSREVQKLVPARVEKEVDGDKTHWWLHLLPGTAPFSLETGQKKGLYAAPARFYKAVKPTGRRRQHPPSPIGDPDQWTHGQEYYAVLREMKFPPSWRVLDLLDSEEAAEKQRAVLAREIDGKVIVQPGWLCKTNQNADNKNSERFFFQDPGRRDVPERIKLPESVREKYEALIRDYQTRHAADVQKRQHPDRLERGEIAFSRFILNKAEARLRGGELVYVRLHGRGSDLEIQFIAPVSWPRVAYDHTIGDLLPGYLHPCRNLDELDPAGRVFGWVREDKEGQPEEAAVAYEGRVRFTHGRLEKSGQAVGEKALTILGTPKPTTTRFYLVGPNSKPSSKPQDDVVVGYDGNAGKNRLRGRKVYRHFLPDEQHMTRDEQSDQNRTVRDPEGQGAVFTFSVTFNSLAPVELGALLWALTLGGKGYHKLGYGKPLGLGSVAIEVTDLTLHNPVARYRSLTDSGDRPLDAASQAMLLAQFRRAFCKHYVVNDAVLAAAEKRGDEGWQIVFEDLPNVKDLLTLLNREPPALPVHYPYSPDPGSQGQFEWFVGNNRLNGPRIELGLASEDQGLPLIDQRGDTH